MDLFLAVLGLCCFAQAFSSCGKQGQPFKAVHRLLIAVTSLWADSSLQGLLNTGSAVLAHLGLVAQRHAESSPTRDRTHDSCLL